MEECFFGENSRRHNCLPLSQRIFEKQPLLRVLEGFIRSSMVLRFHKKVFTLETALEIRKLYHKEC